MKNLILRILEEIESKSKINTIKLSFLLNERHEVIFKLIKNLELLHSFIIVEDVSACCWQPTSKGILAIQQGLFNVKLNSQCKTKDGKDNVLTNLGHSTAENTELNISSITNSGTPNAQGLEELKDCEENLKLIQSGHFVIPEHVLNKLKLNKLIENVTYSVLEISKGELFTRHLTLHTNMTSDLMNEESIDETILIPYNFDTIGISLIKGHLHPLTKMWREIRYLFLEMGFCELSASGFVETTYWNFDVLRISKELQERYNAMYIKNTRNDTEQNLIPTIRQINDEETVKVLRSLNLIGIKLLHRTSYENFKPQKLYCIDRLFQNFDEHFQAECLILDFNLSFANLLGMTFDIFQELGIIKGVDLKPGYNPFTEPSLDIYCYHDNLDEWIKVGNSGMYRPEILNSCGAPADLTALWWGLDLEKISMVRCGIKDIRQIIGPNIDLQMVYDDPLRHKMSLD